MCYVLKQVYAKKQQKTAKIETKRENRYIRFSICFKEKIVREISEWSSINEVCRHYGIKGGLS
jgi:hypothetical protein